MITTYQYPASADLKATKDCVENKVIPPLQNAIRTAETSLESYEMKYEDPPQRLQKVLKMHQKGLEQKERENKMQDKLPMTIGNVLYSSGQAISAKKAIVDWAFIEMPNARTALPRPNKLPSAERMNLFGGLATRYGSGEPLYTTRDNPPVFHVVLAR